MQLKRQVEDYLLARCPITVAQGGLLQVSEPIFVEAIVDALIFTSDLDKIPVVEQSAYEKLRKYLHPLRGGDEGRGWDFGKLPCLSDLFGLLEVIDGVDYVARLAMTIRAYKDRSVLIERTLRADEAVDFEIPRYAVIFSGRHNITVTA